MMNKFVNVGLAACLMQGAHAMESAGLSESSYAKAALSLSVIVIVSFGIYAVVKTVLHNKSLGGAMTNEEFVTARGSASKWTIAWSLYASAVGSWIISSTADYAFWAGIIGCTMYAFAAGIPLVAIGFFGNAVQEQFPAVLSLSDYANFRFGRMTQVMVVLITLFNMAVACSAEYTTVFSLFSDYVGLGDYAIFIVILLGVVTLSYTTYGGLGVSIITDRVQAIFSVLLFLVVAIYILATWRVPGGVYQPDKLGPELNDQLLGKTETGYSSLFTMPFSLLTATIFSEAMWQRAWASESPSALRFGSIIACCMIFVVVFVIGFTGILGGWAGFGYDVNPNLRLFYVLQPLDEEFKSVVSTAIGVLVIVLAVTMSESAIDSLQNGLGGTVNGAIAKKIPDHALSVSRGMIVLLNIPLIIVGSLELNVISLFLVSNMLCSCAAFPIVLGLWNKPFLRRYLTDYIPPVSFIIAMFCLIGYGTSQVYDENLSGGENFKNGVKMAFYDNYYAWDFFLVAGCTSVGATGLLILVNLLLCRGSTANEENAQVNDAKRENSEVVEA